MKKELVTFILLVFIFSLVTGFVYADSPASLTLDQSDATKVTTAYFEEAAMARYFYESRDLEQFTISSVPSDEMNNLTQMIEEYPSFRSAQEFLPYKETKINSNRLAPLLENLSLHRDCITYYACLNELEKTTYKFFSPSYCVINFVTDGNLAILDLYETLDFQYSECDDPSMMLTHYYVSLVKLGGCWLIMAVESDDIFYQAYREAGFNLQDEIAGVTDAYKHNIESSLSQVHANGNNEQITSRATYSTDRNYIPQNAVNYALTYSTEGDSGQVPSYKNDRFYWTNSSCQLFVSQCIWAGFGGSNSQTDINNRRGMDTSGSYQWWSTKTQYNNPIYNDPGSYSDMAWNSWVLCSQFKVYVDAIKNSSTESGIVCITNDVNYNSNDLVGTSGLSQNDLIGAALHVRGSNNGNPVELGHAVIITNATGTSRQTAYYTCYNNCARNIKLSLNFPSSTTSNYARLYVMAPRTLRGSTGATENFLYGDLQPTLKMGTSGVAKTLYGRSKTPVATLTMRVYAPGMTTPSYTFTTHTTDVVSGSVFFNQLGEWKVLISGTGSGTGSGLSSFTYYVRVVTG